MASINGLPPSLIPGANRTNKASQKKQVNKSQTKQPVGQPSKVA
ncbi:chromosome partitioning protein ParA, partial [Vibrio parahaemolyticus]|nr:chromosome partitioning protein ParA [Vibrio parahaemolyticus]NMV43268.1 chromosome partitioning protein ParA [Vibrio parahaemolyticus]